MKTLVFYTLLIMLCSFSAIAQNNQENNNISGEVGFEIRLIQSRSDYEINADENRKNHRANYLIRQDKQWSNDKKRFGRHGVSWWITLLDGTPLKKVGNDKLNNLRFIFPYNRTELSDDGVHHKAKLLVHARKPNRFFNNEYARKANLFQRHVYFMLTIELLDDAPEIKTNPKTPMPLISDVSYQLMGLDTSDSYVEINLMSYLEVSISSKVYKLERSDSTKDIVATSNYLKPYFWIRDIYR